MALDNLIPVWEDFDETFLLSCIENAFRKKDYVVTNIHATDRIHEDGIDLLCKKKTEVIAIQAKIKPKKKDIEQFKRFVHNAKKMKLVYIYIKSPTKPFRDFVDNEPHTVDMWDVKKLHDFLIQCESIDYLCILFSNHSLIDSLLRVHQIIINNRSATYKRHKITPEEMTKLWVAKDNVVKIWVSLYFIHLKWKEVVMNKTEKRKEEFQDILNSVRNDLDLAHRISGDKLVSSFEDLAKLHPDIIGLMWQLASERSDWIRFVAHLRRSKSDEDVMKFSKYDWICPLSNETKRSTMKGFYSTIHHLLDNFQEVTKNIEDAIDNTFKEINK